MIKPCALVAVAAAFVFTACGTGDDIALSPAGEAGRSVFRDSGCTACHGGNGQGGTGPSLQGVWGTEVTLEGGEIVIADEAYLAESIRDPAARIVEGYRLRMPSNDLDDDEIARILDWIEEIGPNATPIVDQIPTGSESGHPAGDPPIDALVGAAGGGGGGAAMVVVGSAPQSSPQSSPSIAAPIAGVLIGLALGLMAFALGPAIATAVLLIAGSGATVVGAVQYRSQPVDSARLVTWWLLPVIAVVAAAGIIATYGRSRLLEAGLLGMGGVMLVVWGVRRRDDIGADVLSTDLPFWIDRLASVAAPIAGLLVLAAAGRALVRVLADDRV